MLLKNFMKPDRVIIGLEGESQDEVLRALIAPMARIGAVEDSEQLVADMLRREAEVTTVIDNGIAFPHARSNAVRSLCLIMGLSAEDGIAFNPASSIRSPLFFCIAIPAFAPTAHMRLLQSLARFSREEKRVTRLLQSKTPAAAARYLGNFKG